MRMRLLSSEQAADQSCSLRMSLISTELFTRVACVRALLAQSSLQAGLGGEVRPVCMLRMNLLSSEQWYKCIVRMSLLSSEQAAAHSCSLRMSFTSTDQFTRVACV